MAKDKFNPEEWLNQPEPAAESRTSSCHSAPSSHARPDRASDDIETITARIESSHTDITAGYDNWRDLGFALSEELGETGRDYFHRISRFNPDYDLWKSPVCVTPEAQVPLTLESKFRMTPIKS